MRFTIYEYLSIDHKNDNSCLVMMILYNDVGLESILSVISMLLYRLFAVLYIKLSNYNVINGLIKINAIKQNLR